MHETDLVEQGLEEEDPKGEEPKGEEPKGEEERNESTTQYTAKLVACIAGLQAAYLTWGVLQVGNIL